MKKLSCGRHRFPPTVIQRTIGLYFRFSLSYRDVEDLLAERGIDVSYEAIRRWVLKFGRVYAAQIWKQRPQGSEQWHLDVVFSKINGKISSLWRAVDDEGEVLDVSTQSQCNKPAALKLMRLLPKPQYALPDAIVTDKLRSYGAALKVLKLSSWHEMDGRLNNRAEVSQQPTGQQERQRRRFKTPGSAQRLLSMHSAVYNHSNFQRHLISRLYLRQLRATASSDWRQIAAV